MAEDIASGAIGGTVADPPRPPDSRRPAPREVVPLRHPGRWIAATIALLCCGFALHSVLTNPNFDWPFVARYFASGAVLDGLVVTLWLTVVTVVVGFVLGTVLAVMRVSRNPVLSSLSWGYVWLFRSTPLLVQLLFWFNIGALYPTLSIGIPFGPTLQTIDMVNLIGPTAAAVIGLVLHEAAYAAEIVRGGLLSVDQGQTEAAQALGLSPWRTFRRVVLPQAMRSIVPAAGNMLIGTLKGTSMVSVLAVEDLLYTVQLVYNRNYRIIPLLLVATLWYVIVTSLLSVVQYYVERFYARGALRQLPPTPVQRLRSRWRAVLAAPRRPAPSGRDDP
ncbi:amino acid ABC transporter permease [Kutzneria viridogrisea]|uniref:His/Glu/Gln/Arg/opine family amino acid ABC transporter, permease n=2 Tax=Kutzneria TaxID=43356 RepID=W5W8L1_9PSEU|nr:amino acid ABC transporter permease [Kutzneria albida]AHH97247.1 His/Glu/Gln/Arg/opine family amino acid ABC transporter, permease [Kutzneria albida DSM 43870]MBA8930839.1 polar amino acid transport system permease protein [Kutzneria viridogrisea]